MANRTYTQYRGTNGNSSAPESTLSNYVSNFHDYFSMRTSQNESIMIIGDFDNGAYKDAIVYTYNNDNRAISKTEYETVNCTVYQNYYTRGNIDGIPSIPTYTMEFNLSVIFIGFVALSLFVVSHLVKHFWKLVRRASHA